MLIFIFMGVLIAAGVAMAYVSIELLSSTSYGGEESEKEHAKYFMERFLNVQGFSFYPDRGKFRTVLEETYGTASWNESLLKARADRYELRAFIQRYLYARFKNATATPPLDELLNFFKNASPYLKDRTDNFPPVAPIEKVIICSKLIELCKLMQGHHGTAWAKPCWDKEQLEQEKGRLESDNIFRMAIEGSYTVSMAEEKMAVCLIDVTNKQYSGVTDEMVRRQKTLRLWSACLKNFIVSWTIAGSFGYVEWLLTETVDLWAVHVAFLVSFIVGAYGFLNRRDTGEKVADQSNGTGYQHPN